MVLARSGALAAALVVAPLAILASAQPAAADVPIDDVCDTTTVGTTITLNVDCLTTDALTIPDGFTLNGNGNTITANDPDPSTGDTYTGAVVTNAAGATTMNIENLTVTGPDGGFPYLLPQNSCNSPFPGLFGIYFNDASGSVTNVEVRNIFQTNTAPGSPACGVGHGIRADGVTADRTVTITDTEVSDFQKSGLFASGRMTMNVTGSTIGPPSSVPFSIAQNSVTYTNTSTNSNPPVGAGGTMTGNTIIGGSFSSTGPADPASNASTAVLLFGSNNVTIDKNQIRGQDLGVSVAAGSTNSVISFNAFTRPTVPTPDSFGIGVSVEEGLADTTDLICNTFDGWNTNIEGDTQEACQAAPSTPHVRTVTSHDRVSPGQPFYDRIHVRGLAGGLGATAVARLYGPFTSRAAATCVPGHRVRTKTLHVDNGWNRTPAVHVNATGVYTWRVSLRANAANRSATHRCGQAVETTTVAKLGYVAPIVQGGFSGTISSPDLARRAPAPATIRMPAIGLRAPVMPERVIDGRMTLPANVGHVGWLRKSAGIGDKIGTSVIAGHVSDRHDNPGAMFDLSRAKAGQQITVTRAGTPYKFKVVSKATFDRRHRLPHRYFVTTGRHRLVLISCTKKVVYPNGHFHYTRYVVVVANRIHSRR